MKLYKAILKKYGTDVSGGIGSFSQMGFTMGEIAVHALAAIKGPYTKANVNKAFVNVKNFKTGMLCEPWTFGHYPLAHRQQHRLHGDARERQDGDCPGLHEDLVGRPADRGVPQGGRRSAIGGSEIHKRSGRPQA